MRPGNGATWLPSVLLLLQVPGCLSMSDPPHAIGTVGGSLNVKCPYEEKYRENKKYWCKNPCLPSMKIVETTESEREVRRGRVSIRDDPDNLMFTVTLENLTEDDGDVYKCGIDAQLDEGIQDSTFQVAVYVLPATTETEAPNLKNSRSTWNLPFFLLVTTSPTMTRQETTDPSQHPQSLLSNVHFLLLVFLKLPLLLSMLSAVLWVHRPQRGSGGNQSQLSNGNQ